MKKGSWRRKWRRKEEEEEVDEEGEEDKNIARTDTKKLDDL